MFKFKIEDTILYEDKEILVCHKPAGIAVQNAGFGSMDLECAARNYLAAGNTGRVPYLAVIHRLDQPVEGAIVFAKMSDAAKELSRQMAKGEMEKKYLAVTSKIPGTTNAEKDVSEHVLRDYLKKDGRTNTSAVVPKGTPGSKEARLTYRVLEEIPDERTESGKRYLLEICLETGRHHQIRVQMAHAGMPLLGDRKYNPGEKMNLPLGLCSCVLAFVHPKTRKKMKFEISPWGEAFDGFMNNSFKISPY